MVESIRLATVQGSTVVRRYSLVAMLRSCCCLCQARNNDWMEGVITLFLMWSAQVMPVIWRPFIGLRPIGLNVIVDNVFANLFPSNT